MDNSFVFFGTPITAFHTCYPRTAFHTCYPRIPAGQPLPFKDGELISTQLPKTLAAVRVVATVIFSSLAGLALSSTFLCWPVVIAGFAFAGWTIYSHLASEDPLIKAFHKITGGKDKFAALPEVNWEVTPNTKTDEIIKIINWDTWEYRISRMTLSDGRRVIIVKGQSRGPVGKPARTANTIFAFVEKTSFKDISNEPDFILKALGYLHAIFRPWQSNTLYNTSSSYYDSTRPNTYRWEICSSIPSHMANEFAAQLGS